MKIRTKLLLGAGTLTLLIIWVSHYAFVAGRDSQTAYRELSEETLPVMHLLEQLRASALQMVASTRHYENIRLRALIEQPQDATAPSIAYQSQALAARADLDASESHLQALTTQYRQFVFDHFPDEISYSAPLEQQVEVLIAGSHTLLDILHSDARSPLAGEARQQQTLALDDLLAISERAIQHERQEIEERSRYVRRSIDTHELRVMGGLLLIALTLPIGLILLLRLYNRPLAQLTQAFDRITGGDLKVRLQRSTRDEFESVFQQFNLMVSRQAELIEQAERGQSYTRSILNSVQDGLVSTDLQGFITRTNPALCRLLDYNSDELLGHHLFHILTPRQPGADLSEALDPDGDHPLRLQWVTRNGQARVTRSSTATLLNDQGRAEGYLCVIHRQENTLEQEDQQLLKNLYDPASGLPNRIMGMDRLTQGIRLAKRQEQRLAVMLISLGLPGNEDLDAGEKAQILRQTASQASNCLRQSDIVSFTPQGSATLISQHGRDAFLVILPGIRHALDASLVADRLSNLISQTRLPFIDESPLSAHIGISLFPDDGNGTSELLDQAQRALQDVRTQPGSGYRFSSPRLQSAAQRRQRLADELPDALFSRQLTLACTARCVVGTQRLHSLSVSAHWRHPQLGDVDWNDLTASARHADISAPLMDWLLRETTQQLARWESEGHPSLTVSIPLTLEPTGSSDWLERAAGICRDTGIAPERLTLVCNDTPLLADSLSLAHLFAVIGEQGFQAGVRIAAQQAAELSLLISLQPQELTIDSMNEQRPGEIDAPPYRHLLEMAQARGIRLVAAIQRDAGDALPAAIALVEDQDGADLQPAAFAASWLSRPPAAG